MPHAGGVHNPMLPGGYDVIGFGVVGLVALVLVGAIIATVIALAHRHRKGRSDQ
jgi:hypothetical protein